MSEPFPLDEHGEPKMPAEWSDPKLHPNFAQFISDMLSNEFPVEVYFGRWGYVGPAVRTHSYAEEHAIMRATTAKLGKESMGLGLVIWAK